MNAVVLEDILGYIHNWFVREEIPVSDCVISSGTLPEAISIPDGAWYRIQGSYLNDGMHLKGGEDEGLSDETFSGLITIHAIPKPLLALAEEVSVWNDKYGGVANSPYQSESFGGYSYTKASGGSGSRSNGSVASGWQSAFAGRFTKWRKLS